jgi:endonuclease YncB( thermonuclease family)
MKNKVFVILILLLFIFSSNVYASERIEATLYSCVDGDTANFVINKKVEKVRFIGINTPEITKKNSKGEPFGEQASNYT